MQSLLEEVTSAQWRRFQSYARRGRGLSEKACKDAVSQADQLVWTVLERLCKAQSLLPNLRFLSTSGLKTECLALLTLLTPSLHALSLSFPDLKVHDDATYARTRPSTRGVFLQLLTPHCQHLTELSIDSGLKDIPENFLASITRLEKLKGLSLLRSGAVADYATLQSISQMTALRDLTLEVSLDRTSKSVALLPLGGAFLGLHRLHLSGKIADLRRVLEACECPGPRLSSLALSISGRTMVDSLLDGLAAICGRLPPSLIALAMSISAKISGLETRTPVPSQIPGLMRVTTQRASSLDGTRCARIFRPRKWGASAGRHYANRPFSSCESLRYGRVRAWVGFLLGYPRIPVTY